MTNTKRDAACDKAGYFDGPGHCEGVAFRDGWDARDAEVSELRAQLESQSNLMASEINNATEYLRNEIKTRDEAIEVAVEALEIPDMDCGDNSCRYAKNKKGGMRTNGGCRCIDGNTSNRILIQRHLHNQKEALHSINTLLGRGGHMKLEFTDWYMVPIFWFSISISICLIWAWITSYGK